MGVEATGSLFLTGLAEVAHTFQVANDTGHIIYILRMTVRTLLQITFVDMTAVVTDCVRDVEGEVVATFTGGYAQQLAVLVFGKVFL